MNNFTMTITNNGSSISISRGSNIDTEDNNMYDQHVEEEVKKKKPTCKDFIKDLSVKVATDNSNSCALCQETINIGEKYITLPCKDDKGKILNHTFHDGSNKEICSGIGDWLSYRNTCPICRCEFPKDKTYVEPPSDRIPSSIMNQIIETVMGLR